MPPRRPVPPHHARASRTQLQAQGAAGSSQGARPKWVVGICGGGGGGRPRRLHPADPVSPQGAMFRCSARCCEDDTASMQEVQRCIERCHAPLAQAQAIVTAELEHFQVRLGGGGVLDRRTDNRRGCTGEPADPAVSVRVCCVPPPSPPSSSPHPRRIA